MGLIADFADKDGLLAARFQAKPLESGPEVLSQAASDRNPVPGRLHVPSDAVGRSHCGAEPGEQSSPTVDFTRVSRAPTLVRPGSRQGRR
jgi:hypothetical protein